MNTKKPPTLIVAGGGTGGHVLAGIAVADEWKKSYGESARVLFVGAKGKIEEDLVPRAGYPLKVVSLGTLNRVSFFTRLKTFLQLPVVLTQMIFLVLKEKPTVVLGVGGYASGPIVLCAGLLGWLWKGKSAILEQNAVPGLTNRLLKPFVTDIFSAFKETKKFFDNKRVVVTGNPIRSEYRPLDSAVKDPFTIFIFGGSQGSVGINSIFLEALTLLKEQKSVIKIIHQTGKSDFNRVKSGYDELGFNVEVESFIYDMAEAYKKASLIISRAGSSTLSEIAAVKRAAILIPLPTAANNHQEKNAKQYASAGASYMLLENSSSAKDLAEMIKKMISQPDLIRSMENNVGQFYRPHAAQEIVKNLFS